MTVTTVAHAAGLYSITLNTPGRSVTAPVSFQFDAGTTTWLGVTSSDWNTASNWGDGVPNACDNCVCPIEPRAGERAIGTEPSWQARQEPRRADVGKKSDAHLGHCKRELVAGDAM